MYTFIILHLPSVFVAFKKKKAKKLALDIMIPASPEKMLIFPYNEFPFSYPSETMDPFL